MTDGSPSPRPPMANGGASALAATMLRVLAAELTDSGRLMRARALQEERAVTHLTALRRELRGAVQGSESTPYQVTWSCEPLAADVERRRRSFTQSHPQRSSLLVPGAAELVVTCDCIDASGHLGHGVCKHAVAVLLEFADEVTGDADRLAAWRGVALSATDPVDDDDPVLDHRPRPDDVRSRRERTTDLAPTSPTFVDPLGDQLSFPDGIRLPAGRYRITPLDPPTGDDLFDEVVADALTWIQAVSPW